VAIKTPRRLLSKEEFREEAQIAAQMEDHPNLMRVTDFGNEGGIPFLVMDYIDGSDVFQRIQQDQKLDTTLALRITRDILEGLKELHRRGIIHRDVKPMNFLIRRVDSRVKLTDYGSATQQGMLGLTKAYAAPELYLGKPATVASDLFAVGVSLFHMLSGRLPWGGNLQEIEHGILHEPPPSLADAVGSTVEARLEAFLVRCLEKNPVDRWPGAAEALEEMNQILQARHPGKTRVAVVARDGDLTKVLAAALQATVELTTLGTASRLTDPALGPLLGQLDAIILDPESAPPQEVERCVGDIRNHHPTVVFFLLVRTSTRGEVLNQFSAEWRKRFEHYFLFPLDDPLDNLPAQIRSVSVAILFDQTGGRSMTATAKR
jgi:serine/threonine protein kinase